MAKDDDKTPQQGTPLAIITPKKPIGEMTDAELDELADELFDGIAATRKPAKGHDR